MIRTVIGAAVALAASTSTARAEELSGRVTDLAGSAVSGAIITCSSGKDVRATTTDADGRYRFDVPTGSYRILVAFHRSTTAQTVAVTGSRPARLDVEVDGASGEVIVIQERIAPKVMPRSLNYPVYKAPPYSEKAILSDAWTRAWMLLDIDETGRVVRFKWLKRPGYDLEAIATAEVFKIQFAPARDGRDQPVRIQAVWSFEWPSVDWNNKIMWNPRSKAPPLKGLPARDPYEYVPCTGHSTVNFESKYPVTRDCSLPDLSRAAQELWVLRPR